MKENEQKKNVSNRKGWSIFGFLVSIMLLTIAIILSMNEEKVTREAKISERTINSVVEQTSSELSKTVNQVKTQNALNEVNIQANEVSTNEQVNQNKINEQENQNEINEQINQNKIDEQVGQNEENNQTQEGNQVNQNEPNAQENGNLNLQTENKGTESNTSNEQFIMPVDGEILSSYSIDNLQYSNTLQEWITHRGIDIKADKTTVVKASKSGKIKYIKEDPRYGLSITIEHSDGFQTVYSSLLSTEFVKEGDEVKQGQSIGTIGNSAVFESAEGSHLHFEILKDSEYVNPDIYLK